MFGYNKFNWLFKAVGGPTKWQRKDGSWWTNQGGQIVPYSAQTHGDVPAHPSTDAAGGYNPTPEEQEEAYRANEAASRKRAQARDWKHRLRPGQSDSDRYGD